MRKTTSLMTLSLVLILSMSILSLSMISAETLVAGKIYNSAYTQNISGASVVIACNGVSLATTSLDDGAYAIKFGDSTGCILGMDVKVTASKDNLYGEGSSKVYSSEDEETEYVAVSNINIKAKPSSGGNDNTNSGGNGGGYYSGHVKYYYCGNDVCDTGETVETCSKDCTVSNTPLVSDLINLDEEETQEEVTTEDEGKSGFFTGAFIGGVSKGLGLLILVIFVLVLAIIFFVVRKVYIKRKKN